MANSRRRTRRRIKRQRGGLAAPGALKRFLPGSKKVEPSATPIDTTTTATATTTTATATNTTVSAGQGNNTFRNLAAEDPKTNLPPPQTKVVPLPNANEDEAAAVVVAAAVNNADPAATASMNKVEPVSPSNKEKAANPNAKPNNAHVNNHKDACSCNECFKKEEAKKNCGWVRRKLYLCNANNANTKTSTKKNENAKAEPTQPNSNTPANSENANTPIAAGNAQVNAKKNLTIDTGAQPMQQELANLIVWLAQLQAPVKYARIYNQMSFLMANPEQLQSWTDFINRLKGIQQKSPKEQPAELAKLSSEPWAPSAPSAPSANTNVPQKGGRCTHLRSTRSSRNKRQIRKTKRRRAQKL